MSQKNNTQKLSRRDFVKGATALSLSSLLANSGSVYASGSEKIKLGLVGCGERGSGALGNCIDAAKHLGVETEVVGLADYFEHRTMKAAERYGVSPELCHCGPDCYKQIINSDADVVLLVTPPNFRPLHFEAAVEAGKHVFMEKPVAVDPPGARRILKAGELAAEKGLAVVAGTQRRHQAVYRQTQYCVENNAIGKIKAGRIWWCMRSLWHKTREPGESAADYMVRNWVSFTEMSGDHIVEQHMHQIDVANWFIGKPPEAAMGFGGRARRKTGNQYDFFSVDYDYGNDVHIHSMCRQIDGCYNRVSEHFVGTEGSTWGTGPGPDGFARDVKAPEFEEYQGPQVQEHVNLLAGILNGNVLNEAENVANSTMTAIMGRISAYTGQLVRWRELMDESLGSPWYSLKVSPTAEDFVNGTVVLPEEDIAPVPGRA